MLALSMRKCQCSFDIVKSVLQVLAFLWWCWLQFSETEIVADIFSNKWPVWCIKCLLNRCLFDTCILLSECEVVFISGRQLSLWYGRKACSVRVSTIPILWSCSCCKTYPRAKVSSPLLNVCNLCGYWPVRWTHFQTDLVVHSWMMYCKPWETVMQAT